MKVICRDRRSRMMPSGPLGRGVQSVSADVERLLGPKSMEQLAVLEAQISKKLQSDEPIDVEYWEQLLRSITVYKAKAELKSIYKSVIESRLQALKSQQVQEAEVVAKKLALVSGSRVSVSTDADISRHDNQVSPLPRYSRLLDPEPQLKIRVEDKTLEVIEESDFLNKIVSYTVNHDLLMGSLKCI